MEFTRFYGGADGETHFAPVDVGYAVQTPEGLRLSDLMDTAGVHFLESPTGLHRTQPHPSPRRQLMVILSGTVEIGTTDGERRRFGVGDVLLADDLGTRGHLTRVIDGPVRFLVARLSTEELDTAVG